MLVQSSTFSMRNKKHTHSCKHCCEGCPVLPSNVPGYPGMSYDIYTEMSDLKIKKIRTEKHHSLALALTLTLTVILAPNHPATSHCCRTAVHCTVFNTPTHQHHSRASQDHPGITHPRIIPGSPIPGSSRDHPGTVEGNTGQY